ncbi:MAG: hypothetical protein GX213_11305 [Clostridiaceae bacterium]|nr:hypothetical protein [Clostridiaceae bacterium]
MKLRSDIQFWDMFKTSLQLVPNLTNIYQTIKIQRLQRRLKDNENKLKRISSLCSDSILSEKYITERIFPVVLSDLIEEHEEAKIELILNGFENVFIDEKHEESVVINLFDTLRTLRYIDIKRLLYLANEIDDYMTFVNGQYKICINGHEK